MSCCKVWSCSACLQLAACSTAAGPTQHLLLQSAGCMLTLCTCTCNVPALHTAAGCSTDRLHSSCCYRSASRAGPAICILIPDTNPELSPFASVTCLEGTQQALQPLLPCAGPATNGLPWDYGGALPLGLWDCPEGRKHTTPLPLVVPWFALPILPMTTAARFPCCTVAFLIATDLAAQQPS